MIQSRRLWISAAIIALVIIVSFALSVPHTREVADAPLRSAGADMPESIRIKDSFRKGTHTITGTVLAGNACQSASAEAYLVGEGADAAIQLAVTLPVDSGICLQVPTPVSFTVTIAAPAGAPITATINGVTASTTAL